MSPALAQDAQIGDIIGSEFIARFGEQQVQALDGQILTAAPWTLPLGLRSRTDQGAEGQISSWPWVDDAPQSADEPAANVSFGDYSAYIVRRQGPDRNGDILTAEAWASMSQVMAGSVEMLQRRFEEIVMQALSVPPELVEGAPSVSGGFLLPPHWPETVYRRLHENIWTSPEYATNDLRPEARHLPTIQHAEGRPNGHFIVSAYGTRWLDRLIEPARTEHTHAGSAPMLGGHTDNSPMIGGEQAKFERRCAICHRGLLDTYYEVRLLGYVPHDVCVSCCEQYRSLAKGLDVHLLAKLFGYDGDQDLMRRAYALEQHMHLQQEFEGVAASRRRTWGETTNPGGYFNPPSV